MTRNARNPLAVPVTIHPGEGVPQVRRPWRTHIIPDGLYGIEYLQDGEKLYCFFALECDRTPPARRSNHRLSIIAGKRAAYDAVKRAKTFRTHWGIPNLDFRFVGEE